LEFFKLQIKEFKKIPEKAPRISKILNFNPNLHCFKATAKSGGFGLKRVTITLATAQHCWGERVKGVFSLQR
jgi:hypothetical protein